MYGKKYWYGREVEGRFADIDTVFIREEIPSNYKEYPHIYFTIEYISKLKFDEILEILESRQVVTIEVNSEVFDKIPMSLFNRCHLIYRIKDEFVSKLKQTDTVSIDAGWYRVSQIMKCHLMEITPDNYKFDRISQ